MAQAAPVPVPVRERVAAIVKEVGEKQAIARLKVGRQTLARVLAGLPVYAGTHALLRQQLDFLDKKGCP